MPLLASLSSLSYHRIRFPETQVELGSYRNERRRTRMRFARAGDGSAVVCVWRISTESRMCIATGKSMPGWTLEVQQRMNVTTPLHRRSGRSRRVVWLVRMVVAVLRARCGCGLAVGDLHEPVRG